VKCDWFDAAPYRYPILPSTWTTDDAFVLERRTTSTSNVVTRRRRSTELDFEFDTKRRTTDARTRADLRCARHDDARERRAP
jgi:hypothetical protein